MITMALKFRLWLRCFQKMDYDLKNSKSRLRLPFFFGGGGLRLQLWLCFSCFDYDCLITIVWHGYFTPPDTHTWFLGSIYMMSVAEMACYWQSVSALLVLHVSNYVTYFFLNHKSDYYIYRWKNCSTEFTLSLIGYILYIILK